MSEVGSLGARHSEGFQEIKQECDKPGSLPVFSLVFSLRTIQSSNHRNHFQITLDLFRPVINHSKMSNAGGLTDREAAIDALIRFVVALDDGDSELSASSLAEDAVMNLVFGKSGMQARKVHGRDVIVDLLMSRVGRPLDTTHMATNIRCTIRGDEAELTSVILAQHFRLGEGQPPETQDYWMNGNNYRCSIVRVCDLWRIKHVTIEPAWTLGKPEVMDI